MGPELHAATGMTELSFGTALAVLPGGQWSATTSSAPLRRWLLATPEDPTRPIASRLIVDETILHHIAGVSVPDERIAAVALPDPQNIGEPSDAPPQALPAHWEPSAHRLTALWTRGAVRLDGHATGMDVVTSTAARRAHRPLWHVAATDLRNEPSGAREFATVLHREVLLRPVAFSVDLSDLSTPDTDRWMRLLAPVPFVVIRSPHPLHTVALSLGGSSADGADTTARTQRHLIVPRPPYASHGLRIALTQSSPHQHHARVGVDNRPSWPDLVLPPAQIAQLHSLAASVHFRGRVLEDWGFAARRGRGLGTSALFTGPSGTGKTFAAEVLATELDRPLMRVDLSQVVNKYIGETEKHLARLFDSAEAEGSVLFFDEADALFGKRTAVRDSHDRYANIEVSYLLQRLESYTGLALLASNARAALDTAFLRRLTDIVVFPHPDVEARHSLWERAFPAEMPREELDVSRLARVDATGATIMAAALAGAYRAAAEDRPVATAHMISALEAELAKAGRVATGSRS